MRLLEFDNPMHHYIAVSGWKGNSKYGLLRSADCWSSISKITKKTVLKLDNLGAFFFCIAPVADIRKVE
ncbi:hypothetical protein ANCCAN_08068 [Ancylostoma caninum]|uniref:Uncharacterized protein n=1 Tax=Ancylostoma caninum TaxID=29170 RepID=A0A368GNF6_ANCCA|nr:hypothetical protein ANCCAN_08068 [Ancylostoma caninum]